MMRRVLGVLAGGVLATGLLMFTPQGTPAAYAEPPGGGDGFHWNYSEEASGYYQPPQSGPTGGGGTPDPDDIITLVESDRPDYDCREHHPQVPGCDGSRANLGTGCPDVGDNGIPMYATYTYQYRWADRDDETQWELVETDGFLGECIETPEFVPDEDITAEFQHELFRRVDPPEIKFRPQTGIVNLPTVLWANGEEVFQDPVTVPPSPETGRTQSLTGYIDAFAEYRWTVDNGPVQATGLGVPYNPAVDPTQPNDYYSSVVFETTGPHVIQLNAHWEGTVTVDPLGPEELDPLDYNEPETITVEQGKPVLRRN